MELKTTASMREIKTSYLRLAKIYHPDVYKGEDKNRFKKIQEAYQLLKNPEKRRDYDVSMNFKQPTEEPQEQKQESDPKTETSYD